MKEILLLVGCVGSGKSTYCKTKLQDYYRISQDEMGKDQALENFKQAVARGDQKIVVDRMNFNKFQRKRWIEATPEGYSIRALVFQIPKEVCAERAKARVDHPTLKAEKVDDVVKMFDTEFQMPVHVEGITSIDVINLWDQNK